MNILPIHTIKKIIKGTFLGRVPIEIYTLYMCGRESYFVFLKA